MNKSLRMFTCVFLYCAMLIACKNAWGQSSQHVAGKHLESSNAIRQILSKTTIEIGVGISGAYVLGDHGAQLRTTLSDSKALASENTNIGGFLWPRAGYHIHISLLYPVSPRLSIGTGGQLHLVGYRMVLKYEEKDPVFQFDEQRKLAQTFRLSTVEIPFLLNYQHNRKLAYQLGVVVGFGVSASSEMDVESSHDVIINGKSDAGLSIGTQSNTVKLPQAPMGVYPGAQAGAALEIYSGLSVGAVLQYSHNYAELDDRRLSDLSLRITASYQIK